MLPPVVRPGGMSVEEIYAIFPNLRERRRSQGTKLSGGEQQMLAIGRILRTGAKLLLLDEPTEGLAPVIVQQIGRVIETLKDKGFTILLVEQNFRFASTIADRHYIVEHGHVVDMIRNAELAGISTSCTSISGSERNKESKDVKRALVAAFAALLLASVAAQAQIAKDTIKIGVLTDMSSLYADLGGPGSVEAAQDGGRRFRRHGERQEDRGRQRRPPEQARYRRQDRPPMVRPGRRRHDHRPDDVERRAGGAGGRAGQEQGDPDLRRGLVRPDRQGLRADLDPLDLRHLRARQRHRRARWSRRAATPGSSSPPITRSAMRWSATPPRSSRKTAARCWARCGMPLNTPISRPSCCRRRPRRPRSSASPMPAATRSTRSSRRPSSASSRAARSSRGCWSSSPTCTASA